MFTSTKIKQLTWKRVCLDRFKISSLTFFFFPCLRNSSRFFFDFTIFHATVLNIAAFIGLSFAYNQANKSFKPPYLFVILSFVLMTSMGISICTRLKPLEIKSHFSNFYKSGTLIEIKILSALKSNKYYQNYTGQILSVDSLITKGSVMIRISRKDSSSKLEINDKFLTSEMLTMHKPPLNPGEFNFKEYARRKGICFQINLKAGQFVKTEKDHWNLRSQALLLRAKIINSLKNLDFSKEEFMVIEALLLGKRQDLSKEITTNYKNAGAIHILAISGLHIGILMMILNKFLSPLERIRRGKKVKLFVLVLFLWSFAFLSGLSASVVRAVTMFSILSIGIVSRRTAKLDHYVFISLFISLLVSPLTIFNLGFQLSYIAVISIISIGTVIIELWSPLHKILNYFWRLVAVSISAQLGILPLSLYYFHHFSAVFILSSLTIIPMLGLILGGGYLMIFLDQIDYLPKFYVDLYGILIGLMNHIIGLLGEIDTLIYRNIYFNFILVLLVYLTIFYAVRSIKIRLLLQTPQVIICFMMIMTILLFQNKLGQTSSNFIVFNTYKESLFLHRFGNKASVFNSSKNSLAIIDKTLEDYTMQHLGLELKETNTIKHFYKFQNKRIMVIDSEKIITDFGFNPDILVLRESPKINLKRLLINIEPSVIVADGSNYHSYKSLWQKTSVEAGVVFHDTSKDGAFILTNES